MERRRPISKKNKSTGDQHIWKEILVSPEIFSAPVEFNDELSDDEISVIKEAKILLNELLFDRVIELVFEHFTDHQKKVLALAQMPGKTYNDIAEILNINYTGVSHAIKGIKSQKHGKYHGGFEKKLKKVCSKDEECQEYIKLIYELRTDNPKLALEILREHDTDTDYWENFSFE